MAIQQHKLRWSHSIEPWFLAYLLLGLTTGGLAMILIPVGMESFGSIGYIGLVTAVVGVGQLTAGAWGELADKYGLHRPLFGGGMLLVSLAFVGFALTSSVVPWTGMALLLGLGSSAALTVANLLIVERHPQEEWDSRVGWLQTAYSIGVVVGLAMAGVLTTFSTGTGMFVAAVTIAVAGVFGWLTTKTPTGRSYAKPHGFHLVPRAEIARTVPLRPTRHHLSLKSIEALGPLIRTPFGIFLAIWVASSVGVAACLSLYPLVMEHVFDIDSGASSGIMAVATAISILMYAPTGRLDKRIGAIRVLQTSLAARLIGFVALSVLGAIAFDGRTELAVVGRSNVGKSSLLNRLVRRKAFARVSNTPGRTREINFFKVNGTFVLADLPGYGYARIVRVARRDVRASGAVSKAGLTNVGSPPGLVPCAWSATLCSWAPATPPADWRATVSAARVTVRPASAANAPSPWNQQPL